MWHHHFLAYNKYDADKIKQNQSLYYLISASALSNSSNFPATTSPSNNKNGSNIYRKETNFDLNRVKTPIKIVKKWKPKIL